MQKKWETPDLHMLKREQLRENDNFIIQYDAFIDATNTESMESFFRNVAYTFFRYGYETAMESMDRTQNPPVLFLMDKQKGSGNI